MTTAIDLKHLRRCFLGITPAIVTTCSKDGIPNVTYLSQVHYVDPQHLALSCQFFNKTRKNLEENPHARLLMLDPLTLEQHTLELFFERSETSGPLFDDMEMRIQAIASQTGMAGIFRLLSADVFRVDAVSPITDFLEPLSITRKEGAKSARAPLTDLVRLQRLSERVNRAHDLGDLLTDILGALEELFDFSHSMVLIPDDSGQRLVTIASHGYGESGIGAEVALGEGLIGTVAAKRQLLRMAGSAALRYARAVRGRVEVDGATALLPEVPLPGLSDPQSQMALPLVLRDRLVGVLAVESHDPLCFEEWHEPFLQIIANQIAIGIDSLAHADEAEHEPIDTPAATTERGHHAFCFYRNDDCVFVDGEYLVRNVPGKILWKLLTAYQREGRVEFSNRELRLDPSLGLPKIKDNLESRLILLRRRLEEKCPDVRIVPVRRGRFVLEVRSNLDLVEKDSA